MNDKHGLFNGPGDTPGFPVHDGEIFQLDGMTHAVGGVIYGGGGSSKVLPCLFNVFHCASQMFTLIPVYYPSFIGDVVLILSAH